MDDPNSSAAAPLPGLPPGEPPVIRETLSFPMPVPTVAHFYLALYQLVERACARSELNGRGVRQVRLLAALEGGKTWERTVTLRCANGDWTSIFAELRRRLEPSRPAGALTDLTLELILLPGSPERERERLPQETAPRPAGPQPDPASTDRGTGAPPV